MKRLALLALVAMTLIPHATAETPRVVIHEFRLRGPAGAADEFVELRNGGEAAVSLAGWKLQGCPATGGAPTDRLVFPPGTVIPARRHVLVAGPGYAGAVPADFAYSSSVADGGGLRLVDASAATVDAAGATSANALCREGVGLSTIPTSGENTAFARSADSGDNVADFVGPQASNAQNLASNSAPVIALAPPGGAVEGALLALAATASDADGDPLSFSWSASLGTLTASGATATLRVADGPSSVTVSVTTTDGEVTSVASATFLVANRPPVISSFPEVTGAWGVPLAFAPVVDDADAYALTYDAGPSFAVGTHVVTLTATDDDGATATRQTNATIHARPATLAWDGPTSGGYRSLTILVAATDNVDEATSRIDEVQVILAVDGVDGASLTPGLHAVTARLAPNLLYEAPTLGTIFDVQAEAPLAPTLSAAPGAAVGSVDVWWSAPDDGGAAITSYQIFRDGAWIAAAATPSFTDEGLVGGATYAYVVLAENGVGPGQASAPALALAQVGSSTLPTPELSAIALFALGGIFMVLAGLGRAWRGP